MSEETRSEDRRIAPRVPFDEPIRLQLPPAKDFIDAATANISQSGMFIRTTTLALPGSRLDFNITLADETALIEGLGEVVRIQGGDESQRPSGMGVRFLDLRGNSAEVLRAVVAAAQG